THHFEVGESQVFDASVADSLLTAAAADDLTLDIQTMTGPPARVRVVTHTITATAGAHGDIDPEGAQTVNDGDDLTFTITPDEGYDIDELTVDDDPVSPTFIEGVYNYII